MIWNIKNYFLALFIKKKKTPHAWGIHGVGLLKRVKIQQFIISVRYYSLNDYLYDQFHCKYNVHLLMLP